MNREMYFDVLSDAQRGSTKDAEGVDLRWKQRSQGRNIKYLNQVRHSFYIPNMYIPAVVLT